MLTWECIGRYFNESTTQENLFDNDSVIQLTGTNIDFNKFVSSDNNAALTYCIDSNRTYDTQYPSRITFKLRLGSYSNSDSIITFIAGLYIKYRPINGTNIPCFTISDADNDAYYPFPEELMNNELCNVELLWIDGTTTLIINDKQILSFKSENIISVSSNTILVHLDDFISFEISNLSFYRVTLYEKFRKPRVKIIQDGMKLTIESPELDSNSVIEKETMFRVVFSDLQQGFKVFNNDISIDGCTFSECIANDNTACELKYTDNDTNNEIVLRLYTFPSENHNKNESISEVFHYYKNIKIDDLYVMELNVIQNNINLRGRYITFNYEGIGTVSKHLIQRHEETTNRALYQIRLNAPKFDTNTRFYPSMANMVFDNLEYKNGTDTDPTHGIAIFNDNENIISANLIIERPYADNINNIKPNDLFITGKEVTLWGYMAQASNNSFIISFNDKLEISKLNFEILLGNHDHERNKIKTINITLSELDENGNIIAEIGTIHHENENFYDNKYVQKVHVDFSKMELKVLEVL